MQLGFAELVDGDVERLGPGRCLGAESLLVPCSNVPGLDEDSSLLSPSWCISSSWCEPRVTLPAAAVFLLPGGTGLSSTFLSLHEKGKVDRIAVSQAKPSTVCRCREVNRVIDWVQLSMGSVFLQPSLSASAQPLFGKGCWI